MIKILQNALRAVAPIGSVYLDKVNDFPSIAIVKTFSAAQQQNWHIGRASIIKTAQYEIRGYVYTNLDSSISDCDLLMRQIEKALQELDHPSLISAKAIKLETDEGLFAPYGICTITCELEWFND